jgi:protein CpxP
MQNTSVESAPILAAGCEVPIRREHMRKTMIMGLGLAATLAGAAIAQGPGGPGGPPPGGMRRGGPGGRPEMMERLFQGITLSDAQKAQLRQIHSADSAKMEATRGAMRAQMDSAFSARQRGDTVAARAIFERGRAQMQAHFDEQAAAARNVLTADQRVQFDKNVTALKAEMQQRMQRGPGGGPGGPANGRGFARGGRGGRGGARGQFARAQVARALFRNITLTDAQKAQLKQLRSSAQQNAQSQRTALRAQFDSARTLRQHGDTASARVLFQQLRERQTQNRDQQIASVRNILTADQRTQFDKNLAELKARRTNRRDGRGHRRGDGDRQEG